MCVLICKFKFCEITYSCGLYSAFKPLFSFQFDFNVVILNYTNQGRLHKKISGGEILRKGTKDTILTSYPGTELRDDHWERCIF